MKSFLSRVRCVKQSVRGSSGLSLSPLGCETASANSISAGKHRALGISEFLSRPNLSSPSANSPRPSFSVRLNATMDLTSLPLAVMADSYKAAHFEMYPDSKRLVAYGTFRTGFAGDKEDTRQIFYGMRYVLENFLYRRWTVQDVEQADAFFKHHNAGGTAYPYPKDLFLKIVHENDGYFPIKVEALPEGTVVHPQCPVYQITAEGEYARLCTFLETVMTHVWYPCTVATLSRRARDLVEAAFERTTVEGKDHPLVTTKLHDFGMRGCTCVEQTVIGGIAHLLNFTGTDTMSAAYYAQFHLNGGKPVAESIPATEHSVMTSWPTEREAILNMIDKYGSGVFACVMDSYDYAKALDEIVPSIAAEKVAKGGVMVLRPDSGDPVEAVLMGLRAAEKAFGAVVNAKGYKVPIGCSVIQGDGINYKTMSAILDAVVAEGYSAESVTFGMGGGLLQRVNRDTMSFATKLSNIVYADGREVDVMKMPQTDTGKYSLPGVLQVRRVNGVPTAYPAELVHIPEADSEENLLKVVYDKRPLPEMQWEPFDQIRERVRREWDAAPKNYDCLSKELKAKASAFLVRQGRKALV